MKTIPLSQGKVAIVDDEDFEHLSQWKWCLSDGGYAQRSQHVRVGVNKYTSKRTWMHRSINNTPDGFITDHINRDKLDNRKCNLRTADKSLNGINREKPRNNTSGHKGVYWDSWSGRWKAELKIGRRKISLGRYDKIEDAVSARNLGEQRHYAI